MISATPRVDMSTVARISGIKARHLVITAKRMARLADTPGELADELIAWIVDMMDVDAWTQLDREHPGWREWAVDFARTTYGHVGKNS